MYGNRPWHMEYLVWIALCAIVSGVASAPSSTYHIVVRRGNAVVCSGVMITSSWMATPASCFCNSAVCIPDFANTTFHRADIQPTRDQLIPVSYSIHPSFTKSTYADNLILIKMNSSASNASTAAAGIAVANDLSCPGTVGSMLSWETLNGSSVIEQPRYIGMVTVSDVDMMATYSRMNTALSLPSTCGTPTANCISTVFGAVPIQSGVLACNGDLGAPMVVLGDGNTAVLGIQVGSDVSLATGGCPAPLPLQLYFLQLSSYIPFIASITYGEDLKLIGSMCGDGRVGATEACDDGNKLNGDGCSSICLVEDAFQCSRAECQPSQCMRSHSTLRTFSNTLFFPSNPPPTDVIRDALAQVTGQSTSKITPGLPKPVRQGYVGEYAICCLNETEYSLVSQRLSGTNIPAPLANIGVAGLYVTVTPSSASSTSTDLSWLWVILGILGGLCLLCLCMVACALCYLRTPTGVPVYRTMLRWRLKGSAAGQPVYSDLPSPISSPTLTAESFSNMFFAKNSFTGESTVEM